jgi:hypothetical protein
MQELQFARIRLRVPAGRAVELVLGGERADVSAQEHCVERDAELALPPGCDAQAQLQMAVDIADGADDPARIYGC